ncbi:hypothetical protein WPS_07470 [Vulcanimicrobium alpinum]|uniref:Uncharacterized protein n=1 Tax=Vulcanimicrobium alpinum TaxID=3016050 RepID=A0AAN2C8Z0_UNVUL|nr:hypothetical protein [Vulcanimicrobium alpinum]BDE05471.1 hypothetical protein WPS_07470 [Vulcanimicrobium alpinum]
MMNNASSIRKPGLAAIIDACAARDRAWRKGYATTAYLLDVALRATLERRRTAQAVRRVLARRAALHR